MPQSSSASLTLVRYGWQLRGEPALMKSENCIDDWLSAVWNVLISPLELHLTEKVLLAEYVGSFFSYRSVRTDT